MSLVEEINDVRELDEFRPLWCSLLGRTADASFMQSLGWLQAQWKHFSADRSLRVLLVSDDGETVGIVPFFVSRQATKVGDLRFLSLPTDPWGIPYAAIGPHPAVTLNAAFNHLRRSKRDWDVLEIHVRGTDERTTRQAMQSAGFRCHKQPAGKATVVDCCDDFGGYWENRPSNLLQQVKRTESRLANQGEVRHIRYRPHGTNYGDDNPRWDLFEHCQQVVDSRWMGSSVTPETLPEQSVPAFRKEIHELACRMGALDLNVLTIDRKPIAFHYCLYYQGGIQTVWAGCDSKHAEEDADCVLAARMIENSFQRSDHTISLGPGSFETMRGWRTSVATTFRCTHIASKSPRAQLLKFRRWVSGRNRTVSATASSS